MAAIGHALHAHATVGRVTDAIEALATSIRTGFRPATIPDFERYQADGGYRLLRCSASTGARSGRRDRDGIMENSEPARPRRRRLPDRPQVALRARPSPAPRLMAVNGDEGEPGTFKDRHYLETDPHRFLEGMLIGAWAVEAVRPSTSTCGTSTRNAARRCWTGRSRRLRGGRARPKLTSRSTCVAARAPISAARNPRCSSRSRASAACRATSRPFPSQVGLFGRPTLINNIETLFWVRDIVEKGHRLAFSSQGRNGRKGLRTFSVSGRVKRARREAGAGRHHGT